MLDKMTGLTFFSGVAEDKLAQIASAGEILEFNQNDVIFHQNDEAEKFYGVLDGEVELSLIFKDKILKADIQYEESIVTRVEELERPIIVDTVKAGEVFGWSALVSPAKWTATAQCLNSSRIIAFPAGALKEAFMQNPELGYQMMNRLNEIISRRLQKRTDKLVEAWAQAFGTDNA